MNMTDRREEMKMKCTDNFDWNGIFVRMMEKMKKKSYGKGFSFGKRDYAVDKADSFKALSSVPLDRFILHKCKYLVIAKLNSNVFSDIDAFRAYLDIIKYHTDLSYKCRSYGKRQVAVSFHGFGLTPYHIRALLHRKVVISSFFVSRIEVKCFTEHAFLGSSSLTGIISLPDAPMSSNRRKLFVIAYKHYDKEHIISYYDIEEPSPLQLKSWGQNLELIRKGRMDVCDFESSVSDMCSILSSLAPGYIRPVSSVKSRLGYFPCGLLIEPLLTRDRQAIRSIKAEVLSIVKSNGYVSHADFIGKFSYLPTLKSRQDAVSHYAKDFKLSLFYLSEPGSYHTKAWKLG